MPEVIIPATCQDCKAQCPFSKEGCAFELAQEVASFEERLGAKGFVVDHSAVLERLSEEAKVCRQGIAAEAARYNEEERIAQRVAKILGVKPQESGNGRSNPPPPVAGNGAGSKALSASVERDDARRSRGDPQGYLSEEDRLLEEKLLNDPNVYGVCVVPRTTPARIPEYEDTMRRRFAEEPFKGLVALMPKRRLNDGHPGMIRLTAYYRGPPVKEALRILRDRKVEAENQA